MPMLIALARAYIFGSSLIETGLEVLLSARGFDDLTTSATTRSLCPLGLMTLPRVQSESLRAFLARLSVLPTSFGTMHKAGVGGPSGWGVRPPPEGKMVSVSGSLGVE